MSTADVIRIGRDDPRASAFIAEAECTTHCHHPAWPGILEDALGHEAWFAAVEGPDGGLTGLMPVCHVRSRVLGDQIVSLPFLNGGGPIGTSEAQARLLRYALDQAHVSSCTCEVRTRRPPPAPFNPEIRRITVVKHLPDDPEELWEKGLRSKVRSQVRRPQKEGMTFRSGPEELGPFYRVLSENMRDLGTPVLPRRFFEVIRARLGDAAVFAAVYHGDQPVAGGCGFVWEDEFEITWASSLRSHSRAAPNMLLYWGLMEDMVRRGVRVFDFGRCRPDGGTHRFKKQWGTEDIPLPWVSSHGGYQEAADRSMLRLASRIWTRMPLAVTNRVGPRLARLMP